MSYTVSQLKELFQDQIAPGNDLEFLRLLQEAEIRVLEAGRWQWCRARATLTPVVGIITLPSTYASILGAQVEGFPTPINAMDFEFAPDGVGEIEVRGGGSTRLIDQGVTDAGVRTYKVVGCDTDDLVVEALLHKAPATLYDSDTADSDIPEDATTNATCPDSGALKLVMLGIILEERYDMGGSNNYFKMAYSRLNEREKTRRGSAVQQPNIRPAGRGVRNIRNFR